MDELPPAAGEWATLHPSAMTAASGATLAALPDGTIVASGPRPPRETYTIVAATDLVGITGLRIDFLPDWRHFANSPGRGRWGNVHLSDVGLSIARVDSPSRTREIRLVDATASHIRPDDAWTAMPSRLRGVIDGDPKRVWDVWHHLDPAHSIFLATRAPVGEPGGCMIIALTSRRTRMCPAASGSR